MCVYIEDRGCRRSRSFRATRNSRIGRSLPESYLRLLSLLFLGKLVRLRLEKLFYFRRDRVRFDRFNSILGEVYSKTREFIFNLVFLYEDATKCESLDLTFYRLQSKSTSIERAILPVDASRKERGARAR